MTIELQFTPEIIDTLKLWRKTKRDATHCKYFPTFDDLRNSVIKTFEKFMRNATKVLAVMKKLRQSAGLLPALEI